MKLASKKQAKEPRTKAVLLSEAESCSLAGVTAATLNSYTEFGLLKPVIKNSKPFYRQLELSKLFNVEMIPTLDDLVDEEPKDEIKQTKDKKVVEIKEETNKEFLPAVKVESALIVNKELETRVKSLEEERNWLRNRIEQLEQHSAREQMLLLREKETLREVLSATLNKKEESNQKNTKTFQIVEFIKSLPFFGSSKN